MCFFQSLFGILQRPPLFWHRRPLKISFHAHFTRFYVVWIWTIEKIARRKRRCAGWSGAVPVVSVVRCNISKRQIFLRPPSYGKVPLANFRKIFEGLEENPPCGIVWFTLLSVRVNNILDIIWLLTKCWHSSCAHFFPPLLNNVTASMGD